MRKPHRTFLLSLMLALLFAALLPVFGLGLSQSLLAQERPLPEQRAAALKTINAARGRLEPDIGKLLAAGETRDLYNPKHHFVNGDLSRIAVSDEVLNALAAFPELERLSLSQSRITDDQLAKLPLQNLKYLDLNDTAISDLGIEQLWPLKKLEALELARTAVTGNGLATLATLRNLQTVILDETLVSDAGMAYLAKLPKLADVGLAKTAIGDLGLNHFRNVTTLRRLGLIGTRVTDAGLIPLQNLARLTSLQLDDTHIGDDGIETLGALPHIRQLSLGNTKITDASAATLAHWTGLVVLRLNHTGLTDVGVKRLRELKNLTVLNLSGMKITDAALDSLAKMDELEVLDLGDTPITDAGIKYLRPLVALRQLNLSGTQIAEPPLEVFKALPRLTSIDFRKTRVSTLDVFRAVPETSRNVQAIQAALNEKTELDFSDQPLSDVIDYLQQRHEILIQLDMKTLDDVGVGSDTPITRQLKGVTLREALEAILDPLKLAFGVRHEVLLIAAKPLPEEFADYPVVRGKERLSPNVADAFMQKTELDFAEQPLHDVIAHLAKKHGIEIELDARSLVDAGVGFDTPITRNIKGITLKSALELLLDDLDLTCVAEGKRVIIRGKKDQ